MPSLSELHERLEALDVFLADQPRDETVAANHGEITRLYREWYLLSLARSDAGTGILERTGSFRIGGLEIAGVDHQVRVTRAGEPPLSLQTTGGRTGLEASINTVLEAMSAELAIVEARVRSELDRKP